MCPTQVSHQGPPNVGGALVPYGITDPLQRKFCFHLKKVQMAKLGDEELV